MGFLPKSPPSFDWLVIVYTGVVTSAIGLTVWNSILRTLRSYEASILGSTSIIWTSILAVLILHEQIEKNQIIGICHDDGGHRPCADPKKIANF